MRRVISIVTVGMLMAPFILTARAQAPAAPHQFLNMGKPYDVVVVMLK